MQQNVSCPIDFSSSVSVSHQVKRLSQSELESLQDYLIENEVSNIQGVSSKYVLEMVMRELENFK